MPERSPSGPGARPEVDLPLGPIADRVGFDLTLVGPLPGGEQGGAVLVRGGETRYVLTLQADPERTGRLLRAAPVVRRAVARGWPAADWLHTGLLPDGVGFVLQEHLSGTPVGALDVRTVRAIIAANDRQRGLGDPQAADDAAELRAVLDDDHPWTASVRGRSPAGAALVRRGGALIRRIGPVQPIRDDLVHGDYSRTNMIMVASGPDPGVGSTAARQLAVGTIRFVDCETVARGSRVRDLADLYRSCFLYPGASSDAVTLLAEHAAGVAGPRVFSHCAVAVTYNNLAWWVGNRMVEDFDAACARLHGLFDTLDALI